MIETILREYLQTALNVPCLMEVPKNPSDKMVILERTGGTDGHIKTATIAIQSYGKSLLEAASLNEEVKRVMKDFADLNEVCKVELNSDYNFTDTSTKRYRYQAVFGITHY